MKTRRITAGAGALALAAAAVAVLNAAPSTAAGATIVATPTASNGWAKLDAKNGGVVSYVGSVTDANGVSATGNGSLNLATPTNDDKADYYRTVDGAAIDPTGQRAPATTPLSSVTGLGYRIDAASTGPQASYQLKVLGANTGSSTGFTTLVWEPYMQPNQGANVNGDNTWHTYADLQGGSWWSTKSIPIGGGATSQFQQAVPLSQIIANNPGAVVYQYGINLGTYNAGGQAYVDDVSFNGTTTNFELDKVATKIVAEAMIIYNFSKTNGSALVSHLSTAAGAPLAGKTITYRTGPYTLCSAVTDATGTASCKAPNGGLLVVLYGGYDANFAGDALYGAAYDRGLTLGG